MGQHFCEKYSPTLQAVGCIKCNFQHVWQPTFRWLYISLSIKWWILIVTVVMAEDIHHSNVLSMMDNGILMPPFELSYPSIFKEKFKNKYLSTDIHRILNFTVPLDVAKCAPISPREFPVLVLVCEKQHRSIGVHPIAGKRPFSLLTVENFDFAVKTSGLSDKGESSPSHRLEITRSHLHISWSASCCYSLFSLLFIYLQWGDSNSAPIPCELGQTL